MEKNLNCEENHEKLSEKVYSDSNTGKENKTDHLTADTPCQGDISEEGEMGDALEKVALERVNSPLSDRNSESQADGEIDNVVGRKANVDGEADESVGEGCLRARKFESVNVSLKESKLTYIGNVIKGNEKCSAAEKEKKLDSKIRNNDSQICHAVGSSDVNDAETQEFAADKEESLSPEIGSRKKNSCSVLPGTPSKSPGRRRLKIHVFDRELTGVKSTENISEQFQEKENYESIKKPTRQISDRLISQGSISHDVVSEPLTLSSLINQTESQLVYSGESLEVSSRTTEAANMPPNRTETENVPECESLKVQDCSQDGEVIASEKLVCENLAESKNQMSAEVEKSSPLSDNEEKNKQNFDSREENLLPNPFANQVFGNKQVVTKLESNLVNSKEKIEGELLASRNAKIYSHSEESFSIGNNNPEIVKGNSKIIGTSYSLVDESDCSLEDDEENVSRSAVVVSPKMAPRDLDHEDKATKEGMNSNVTVHERKHMEGAQADDRVRGIKDGKVVLQTEIDKDKHSRNKSYEDVELQEDFMETLESIGKDSERSVNEAEDYKRKENKSENSSEEVRMDDVKETSSNNSTEHKEIEVRIYSNTSEDARMDVEEAVNNESEDYQESIDKNFTKISKEVRMDMNDESEDCQERDDKSSENIDEEIKMNAEKEVLNVESKEFQKREDKSSINAIEMIQVDAEEVRNSESKEYTELKDKSSINTSEEIKMDAEKEEVNDKSKEYQEKEEKSSKTSGKDVILDVEKETLDNDHESQGRYVKADQSKEIKETVRGENGCQGKSDDISGQPEKKFSDNEFDSQGKGSNDTEQNSDANESMPCDEKLEAQEITDQSKILGNQPPHDGSQEYHHETPSSKEINSDEIAKELCNNSIENETDSQEESELVIDDGSENQENLTLAESPKSQKHKEKDSIGKSENVAGKDLVHKKKSSAENNCGKSLTEIITKDIQEKEMSGDCSQTLHLIDKEGKNDEKEQRETERADSKTKGKEQIKKQVKFEDTAKNTDKEEDHQGDGSKSVTSKIHSKSAVTTNSKRKCVGEDDEGFSPKAKLSKNRIDKSNTTKTGQNFFSNSREIECVAMEKAEEKVQCINLSSDEEKESVGQPSTNKSKVCHRCCDIWNDEVLRLIFKGTECVTVNSKITYGAIVLINNWINRNVSGDKRQVITSVFERADLGKNIAKLNISKLDHWLDQLLSSKKIKCCDVFTAVYCSDKTFGQRKSSKAKPKNIKAIVMPSPSSKPTQKEISPSVSQHVNKQKNITLVPTNSLAPSQTNQGVKLCGVAPSEMVTLLPSSVASGKDIILQTSREKRLQPYKVVISGDKTSGPVSPRVLVPGMLPTVIRLGTPVSASGVPIHSLQSSSQPKAMYLVNPSLSRNVAGPSKLRMTTSTMSFNPKIGKIVSMANSSSAAEVLAGDSCATSSLPGKPFIQMAELAASDAGNKTCRSVESTRRKRKKTETTAVPSNLKSGSVNAPVLPGGDGLHEKSATDAQDNISSLTSKKLNTPEMRLILKRANTHELLGIKKSTKKRTLKNASPNKMDESDMNTRADTVDDEHFGDTLCDDDSDASDEMPDAIRNNKDTENIVTNNVEKNKKVDLGKSQNTENTVPRGAGSTTQSLLETLGLDLKATNIYMANAVDSPITNEAMLKKPSTFKEKSSSFSDLMPGYFSMSKEHSALHDFAKEAFNILMFEPHNFNVEKDGKLKPNRFITKRELLTLQNMCILNAENPDANLFYEIFLQILLSRNQVLLIPDSRTLLLITEEIRKEYNRAKAKDASIQILNENWDVHNIYCAEDVLLRKGDLIKEPTLRDLIIVFCTWKNLKKNFPDKEFDEALQVLCKNVNMRNIDKVGVCVQFYIKYCRYLYEEKDTALTRAFLDEPFYSSQIVASKKKVMAAKHGQTALDCLNADEKEIECYIDRCKELQKAAMNSPNQHVYENLCDEMIKLKVKLKNFTAVNDLMKKRIQAVEAKRGNIVKMVKHPQGKYLMRKLRNSIESTHKLFLKRYFDDHTDSRSSKRQKTLSNGDVSHSKASEDEFVSPQIQTLIENLLSKGVKPEQVKTVINTVLVNFEREVPLILPSERWIKNFAKIISACER